MPTHLLWQPPPPYLRHYLPRLIRSPVHVPHTLQWGSLNLPGSHQLHQLIHPPGPTPLLRQPSSHYNLHHQQRVPPACCQLNVRTQRGCHVCVPARLQLPLNILPKAQLWSCCRGLLRTLPIGCASRVRVARRWCNVPSRGGSAAAASLVWGSDVKALQTVLLVSAAARRAGKGPADQRFKTGPLRHLMNGGIC